MRDRFNIDVRTRNEVLEIDRAKQEIRVRNLEKGNEYREQYDALVLATGSTPVKPPVPGVDLERVLLLRTIADSQKIKDLMKGQEKRVAIIGGGAIGLEAAENLVKIGASVTIIDILPQVMPTVDAEIAVEIQRQLTSHGVTLHLGDGVAAFQNDIPRAGVSVVTRSGARIDCDMVLLSTGVKPEVDLARQAGLEIGGSWWHQG